MMNNLPSAVLNPKNAKSKYPEVMVKVLDDNFNTFQDVANCILKIIPGMNEKKSMGLNHTS